MPVDDVAALLARWREADSVVGRGRLMAQGARLLAGLDGDERRLVAQALVDEGAPDLARRLGAQTGQELSPDQVRSVASGLLSLDRDQVDHLVTSLSDPAERERLARAALEQAAAEPGAHEGDAHHRGGLSQLDLDRLPPPGAAPAPRPDDAIDLDDPQGLLGLHAIALGEIPYDDLVLGDQALGHPEVAEVALGGAEVHAAGDVIDVGLHEVELATPVAAAAAIAAGATAARPEAAATEAPAEQPGEPVTDGRTDAPFASPPSDGPPEPPLEGSQEPLDGGMPVLVTDERATPEMAALPRVDGLLRELRASTSAMARVRLLAATDLDGMAADTALQVLDAVPAGWQRRRAADRLLAAAVLPTDDLQRLFDRFPGPSDARFVAGSLVAAGTVEPGALTDVLPARDVARLSARHGRPEGG